MASRKSVLYLNSVLPVSYTLNDVVVHKLEAGKFIFTITGIIRFVGILLGGGAISLFLGSNTCSTETDPEEYRYIYSIAVGLNVGIALLLYILFVCGIAVSNPGLWVYTDICLNSVLSIVTVIVAVLTISNCSTARSLHQIPGPVAIASAIVLIASCFSMFLLYRYVEEDNGTIQRRRTINHRFSMAV